MLTLLIYRKGFRCILTSERIILSDNSVSLTRVEDEIQSFLDHFYRQMSESLEGTIDSIDLIYVNNIFHRTSSGKLEAYMNRLPGYLLYHREYFNCPVRYGHIAGRLYDDLCDKMEESIDECLWFHLRDNVLYVLFSNKSGERSITSFEVFKALDVHYYILFNFQTLKSVLPGLENIVVSGELLEMDQIHNFFSNNIPDLEVITYWQWQGMYGRPNPKYNLYLPEVNYKKP